MIPNTISREDLLEALKRMDREGYDDRFESTKFDLVHEGRRYPPKMAVRIAAEIRDSTIEGFSGGRETNAFLQALGFVIVPKLESTAFEAHAEPSLLDQLRPTEAHRVIDLVGAAGLNTGDWANFDGGAKKAASNPKYCYEWAFSVPGCASVVNLWHEDMRPLEGTLSVSLALKDAAAFKGLRKRRAATLLEVIARAKAAGSPLRVVINAGKAIDAFDDDRLDVARVSFRSLDEMPWHVASCDTASGTCTLTRGPGPTGHTDQFDQSSLKENRRRSTVNNVFVRDPAVRQSALTRAQGHCEYCNSLGFVTKDGRIFLETHHVFPLSEGGLDRADNVAALCPNHHREAHLGSNALSIRTQLERRLASLKSG